MARTITRATVFGLCYSRHAHERSGPVEPVADEPFSSPLRALQPQRVRRSVVA